MSARHSVMIALAAVVLSAVGAAIWQFGTASRGPLRLSSDIEGRTYAAFGREIARLAGEGSALRIEALPSAGASENALRLADGTADLALVQSDTPMPPGTAIIARLFPEAFNLVARDDARIATVNDL